MTKYTAQIPKKNFKCPVCADAPFKNDFCFTIDTESFTFHIQCNYCGKDLGSFEIFEENPILTQIQEREKFCKSPKVFCPHGVDFKCEDCTDYKYKEFI